MDSSSDGSGGKVAVCLGAFAICKCFLAVPILESIRDTRLSFKGIIFLWECKYRTLAKEGPWAVHLTLDQDWGMGQYHI